MAAVDPTTKTTYATTDWSHYQRGRPPYPPSLTSLILSYHAQAPNPGYTRLVDIGAGSGIASTPFIPSFKHIHISDPSPSNLSQARSFLASYSAERNLSPPVLEFSQSIGEEAHLHTGPAQADFVICATAAHFIDPDGLAKSIAAMLKPGGTMAVFSYWMPSFPGKTEKFEEAFAQVFDKLVLASLQAREPETKELSETRLANVVERRMTGEGVLDSLPAPGEWFEGVERVYVNAKKGDIPLRGLFQKFAPKGKTVGGKSRVEQGEKEVRYESGRDEEAEGWEFEVDKGWLGNFFDTIRPEGDVDLGEEAKKAMDEWEAVFEKESEGGRVVIRWPAYVVLARRK
ncbi:S-adenosyl-L-methionine-dependent methyltransferase [Podospora australis]|uniref:S-adenosyl-L-methionine-dependent methyltransferase n=1 Tax=Podospora australis TaxID=1536484 RepID=A0AAN6WNB4_9PEZI|nr:S-adenosyl-L-methionine-dependent methyltransferase [Podospora australis]